MDGRFWCPCRESFIWWIGRPGPFASCPARPVRPLIRGFRPTAQLVACVRDNEIFVVDTKNGTERQLTHGATATLTHGLAEFVGPGGNGPHARFLVVSGQPLDCV